MVGGMVRVLDVAEMTAYIKDILDSDPILSSVWVRGEISNFVRSTAGHLYFTLKGDRSQVKCVLFRGNARWLTFIPGNGDAVLVHGNVSVYEANGQYQLYVDLIQPEGTGILQLQFEELRRRLESEGLFDPSRKRPLPAHPHFIGVVTSPAGAVWHDIQTVLRRRYPLCCLVLAPSTVQGQDAPEAIARAIDALHDDGRADVIVIARGGGSLEDLWCFNDERVARAVFASRIPVVSAIGHETDVTICDLVADVRAPTPSAAAEIIAPSVQELRAGLVDLLSRAEAAAVDVLRDRRSQIESGHTRLQRCAPGNNVRQERLRIDARATIMHRHLLSRIDGERTRIVDLGRQLGILHPIETMQRGYAMVLDGRTGDRIGAASALEQGQHILLRFHDGIAGTTVESVEQWEKTGSHVHTAR
jgi:exodeoxyribonuclease VII large subunit